jgi:hypothetical protein
MTIVSPKLPDITTKADLAVFGLGYAVGFVLYAVLRMSTPPPTTVALAAAIAALAIKSGIQAWQEREPPPISEQERQENLRNRLSTFEELFSDGAQIYEGGRVSQANLQKTVYLERRWEPNPNYEGSAAQGGEEATYKEPPYVERDITEAIYERILVLRILWRAGIVTDAYAEARLDELSDLCSRKATIQETDVREDQIQAALQFPVRLQKLMSEKGMSRSALAVRANLKMSTVTDLESIYADPKWSTICRLAEALEVDPAEFMPRQSDG